MKIYVFLAKSIQHILNMYNQRLNKNIKSSNLNWIFYGRINHNFVSFVVNDGFL